MTESAPRIVRVAWPEITAWARTLAVLPREWDHIVGVSRGGVPLAVTLAYLCEGVPLTFMTRTVARMPDEPFYVFGSGRVERLERNLREFFVDLPPGCRKPLVVDDVVTFGDTLTVARQLLVERGATEVFFATYGADTTVLQRERRDILKSLSYHQQIDNSQTWLQFPWHSVDGP